MDSKYRRPLIAISSFLIAFELVAISIPKIDVIKMITGYGLTSTIIDAYPLITPAVLFSPIFIYIGYKIWKGGVI